MLQWILLCSVVLTTIVNLHVTSKIVKHSVEEFQPAGIPTNLTATATVYNATRRLLQLNINWIPNKEGPPADNYNIHAWSLNDSDTHCTTERYYAFVEDPNSHSWVISPEPMFEAIHENNILTILPECSYRIKLEANPHDGKTFAETDYKVPDCVEGICSCRQSGTLLKPQLNVEHVTDYEVNITWSVTDQQNISSFNLRVGPKLLDGTYADMYNLTWSKQIPINSLGFYHELYTALVDGKHAATIRAVDTRHCQGPEQQLVFHIGNEFNSSETMFSSTQIFWMTSVPSISFLLVFCLIAVFLGPKCLLWFESKKQNIQAGNPHFFYRAIRIKSERVFRRQKTIQEWNVLYVEKEIEDAKLKGLVDSFEISSNRLTIHSEIGRGAFGQVFLANAVAIRGVPGARLVAVKKLRANAGPEEKEEFLEEISMLKKVGEHPNIVSLLACCTLQADLCMVMEFIPCGDLLKYLRKLRRKLDWRKPSVASDDAFYSIPSTVMTSLYSHPSSKAGSEQGSQLDYVLDHRELHNFALQIARGMAHLEAKKITHRDLAARNILIDENKVLKISDFGLSRRGVYVNTRRRKVPLRWLSVEAMKDSLYSSKSDVWAFAILMWEIGTLGGFPYPTVSDYDLLDFLKDGNRLEKPDIVSNNLYSVMLVCWSETPDDRPSFADLVAYLEPNTNRHVYVDFTGSPTLPPTDPSVSLENSSTKTCK